VLASNLAHENLLEPDAFFGHEDAEGLAARLAEVAALSPAERAIAEKFQPPLKEALGEAAFEAAFRAGRTWSFEEAVARAFEASPRIVTDAGAAVTS
jgi:hypothetical protein